MGFTGRPSAGCAVCKQRRKKCDLTKPFCQQCTKTNRKCPGVPDEIDLLFRNKFTYSASKPTGLSQVAFNSNIGTIFAANYGSQQEGHQASCPIARAVPTDWTSTAITYYFNLHCQPYFFNLHSQRELDARRLNPWLELQSEFFAVSKPGTGLNHAVQALATLTMAIDLHLPDLFKKAYSAYGCGLRTVNNALRDCTVSKRNDVALAVFAMISFELKQRDPNFFQRYRAHSIGMKQLLVLRGKEQLQNVESLKVFRALRIQIICDHILRGEALNIDGDGSIWIENHPDSITPADSLWAIGARIPNLLAATKRRRGFSLTQSIDCLSDALHLDLDLIDWLSQHSEDLESGLTVVTNQKENFWQNVAHIYADLSTATLLNQYYFMRVQVLEALMKLMEDFENSNIPSELRDYNALYNMHRLADKLCYSLPFITGQVREKAQSLNLKQDRPWAYPSHGEATWILMPVVVVAQQEMIDPAQKVWLRQQLNNLNADFGLIDAIPALRDQAYTTSALSEDHSSDGRSISRWILNDLTSATA